jgi:RNA polymerase-associated protein
MATQASRRNTMTLFTAAEDMYCHHVRIVLAEKGIAADWVQVNAGLIPEEVYEVNPYGSLPTLIDRDLSLYQSDIILEYLDERFPHPPLLPVYPVARAQARQMLYRIRRDWFSLVTRIEADAEGAAEARRDLRESLLSIAPLFDEQPFFMSDEFSLLDCYLAALLWRLPKLGIELQGPAAKSVKSYMIRVFERDGFQQSLTEKERRMRADW